MKLLAINTGNLKLDGGAMFSVVPKVIWNKLYPADENNLCNWSMRCLLVDTGDRRILIDSGMGNKQSDKFFGYYYPNGDYSLESSLAEHGYTTDDITDNVITHLHFDHCGGSIKYNEDKTQLIPTFKNANFWVSRQQWELALNPNKREKASFLKENILPMQESGKLKLVDNNTELFSDFKVKIFTGHTDGQMIPYIKYKERTIIFMADLIPSVAHLPIPFLMSYDIKPLELMKEKEEFLNEAAKNNSILFFEHDLYHECCSLKITDKGVRENETFNLEEL
ncbi:MAG: MBL fold metallo-hydrolase [Bacteroidetes bacterium GWA2_31_9]|nr:MAG: MBL fold metallo-hydrolase [Bacteroidetes bacterium GWA2_31_9]